MSRARGLPSWLFVQNLLVSRDMLRGLPKQKQRMVLALADAEQFAIGTIKKDFLGQIRED
jgi:hypothetical protein